MRRLGGLAVEIVASVWLVIVAVQFLDTYFGTSIVDLIEILIRAIWPPLQQSTFSLDLTYTYWAMLAILAAVSGVRAVKWFRDRK